MRVMKHIMTDKVRDAHLRGWQMSPCSSQGHRSTSFQDILISMSCSKARKVMVQVNSSHVTIPAKDAVNMCSVVAFHNPVSPISEPGYCWNGGSLWEQYVQICDYSRGQALVQICQEEACPFQKNRFYVERIKGSRCLERLITQATVSLLITIINVT